MAQAIDCSAYSPSLKRVILRAVLFWSHTSWFLLPLLSQHMAFVGSLFFNGPVRENTEADHTDSQHRPVDQYCMHQLDEGWRWYVVSKEREGEERCTGIFFWLFRFSGRFFCFLCSPVAWPLILQIMFFIFKSLIFSIYVATFQLTETGRKFLLSFLGKVSYGGGKT